MMSTTIKTTAIPANPETNAQATQHSPLDGKYYFGNSLDIKQAYEIEPPPLDFLWEGGPKKGTVAALVAPGATGKSFWALELALALALDDPGRRHSILGISAESPRRVLYYAGEDDLDVLRSRMHSIGKILRDDDRLCTLERTKVVSLTGNAIDVMGQAIFDPVTKQRELSDADKVIHDACMFRADLIIFDTLSRIHNLDENSNRDMSMLIKKLEEIAAETDATVLYLHHVSKSAAREGMLIEQQAARGATALIDNCRWCGYIAKCSEEDIEGLVDKRTGAPLNPTEPWRFLRFGVSKINYGVAPSEYKFQRYQGGVMLYADLDEDPAFVREVSRYKVDPKTGTRGRG